LKKYPEGLKLKISQNQEKSEKMAITNFKIFFKFRIIIRFFKDQKKSFFTFFFQEKNLVGFFC